MKRIKLDDIRDIEIVLTALFAVPSKGLEALRLVDKVLTSLERIVSLKYDADGNVIFFESENGRIKLDENNRPVRAFFFKGDDHVLELDDAHVEFLKARLGAVEWQGAAARAVLRFLEKLERNGENH